MDKAVFFWCNHRTAAAEPSEHLMFGVRYLHHGEYLEMLADIFGKTFCERMALVRPE